MALILRTSSITGNPISYNIESVSKAEAESLRRGIAQALPNTSAAERNFIYYGTPIPGKDNLYIFLNECDDLCNYTKSN